MHKYGLHIITARRTEILSHREFFYTGNDFSKINFREKSEFLYNIQKALILSLEKRKLLTAIQRKQCITELEKQNEKNRDI